MNLPYELLKIGDEEYRLKINARSAIELEKKLGKSIVEGMTDFDKIGTVTAYLHAALQAYNAGFSESAAVELYDDYISSGRDLSDFSDILVNVLIVSGFLKRPQIEALRAQFMKMQKNGAKQQSKS